VKSLSGLVAGAALFAVLATANAGGYRFGVSDQAYYVPAVALAAEPDLFPRDRVVLETQTGLMAADDALAAIARATGLELPAVFLGAYVVTLIALFAAAAGFARTIGLSWWATAAALLLLTLRHRIAKTGANSLEGYMHPRELAFALGVAAWVCLLRRRPVWALVATAVAGLVHPTTALWFGASIVVALAFEYRRHRVRVATAAAAAAAAAVWALSLGPLAGRLVVMDAAWLAVLADKDYLFAAGWPLYAWVVNLGYVVVLVAVHRARSRAGLVAAPERALVAGLLALVAGFLVSVPLAEMHLALAVQLQVNRIFWLLDFVAAVYLAWWVAGLSRPGGRTAAVVVVAILALASAARGVFLLAVTHAERGLVEVDLPRTPWTDVMGWVERQPGRWHVLADPGHAWKYGTSVRAAALRDTLLEAGKDAAMAMYDRDVAMRVADRMAALSGFDRLTTGDVLGLDARYDLDVAVVETAQRLELPELYRNASFVVYDLR
jgi:hypothetical protein